MKVFLAVKSVSPSYGGPAFSVSRLAVALADAGVEVGLWASDASARESPLLPLGRAIQLMSGRVADALDRFGRPDILHDNGIWLPHNHRLASLAGERNLARVVSTRGMLEPWAIGHKKLKKTMAWLLYQRRDLASAAYHHATAAAEAETLRALRLGVPIVAIPNGIDVDVSGVAKQQREGAVRTALFLGRIHPVKGLALLIEAWARLRPPGWQLDIAGPDEGGYRGKLAREVAAASLSNAVRFIGPLDSEAKTRAFANADLFVLPSFSESFGMAVGEALAQGVPVLTTTGTPWSGLATHGCGWTVAPTMEGITEGLRHAISLGSATLTAMGRKGREWMTNDFAWANIAKCFINTYEASLRGGRINHQSRTHEIPDRG